MTIDRTRPPLDLPPDSPRETWVPLGWEIDFEDYAVDADNVRALVQEEASAPLEIKKDLSLRAKIIDSCGMTCTFCHNEGTPVTIDNPTGEIAIRGIAGRSGRVSVFSASNGVDFLPGRMEPSDPNFRDALAAMRDHIGLRELHLTGGEPTLHPSLVETISLATSLGYSVSMTSNGEKGSKKIRECADAGLRKINFSIFGTTPAELAAVQNTKYRDEDLAAKKIDALQRSIEVAADTGITVAANIVMVDRTHAERVVRLIDEFDSRLDVRILPDLTNAHASASSIYELLSQLKAQPVLATVEAGSSNARVRYVLPNGRLVTFKQIRPTRIDECAHCEYNNPEDCKEGYYGSRLYVDTDGQYKVGVCLQRMDLTAPIEDFLAGPLAQQIVSLREAEYKSLQSSSSGKA